MVVGRLCWGLHSSAQAGSQSCGGVPSRQRPSINCLEQSTPTGQWRQSDNHNEVWSMTHFCCFKKLAQKSPSNVSSVQMVSWPYLLTPPGGWRTHHFTSIVGDHRPRCITSRATQESFKAHFGVGVLFGKVLEFMKSLLVFIFFDWGGERSWGQFFGDEFSGLRLKMTTFFRK